MLITYIRLEKLRLIIINNIIIAEISKVVIIIDDIYL